MSSDEKEPLQIVDNLIYRLENGINCDEINVSMWNGSRGSGERAAGAKIIISRLCLCKELVEQLEKTLRCIEMSGECFGDMDAMRRVLAKANADGEQL